MILMLADIIKSDADAGVLQKKMTARIGGGVAVGHKFYEA